MAEPEDLGQQKIPPKLVIRPENGSSPAAAGGTPATEAPKTVRLKPSPALPTGSAAKKETAKIPLAEALLPGAGEPRTIRLRPDTARPPAATPAVVPTPALADGGAEKRRTAKISLEAALGPSPDEAPRTIRLKKPSEAGTVRVGAAQKPKTDTAPIGALGSEPVPETVDTRKKTIKVRRPGGATGVVVVEEGGASAVEFQAGGGEDRPHWFFLVTSIAAVLVTCVLAYCLSAQAFGPNASMTQLSYGAQNICLSWPGRIGPGQ
jgi:hypothetical protein